MNSYKAFHPLPEEKQTQLAEALSNEEVLAEKMEGVVEILQRANELGASEDGEVELDLRCAGLDASMCSACLPSQSLTFSLRAVHVRVCRSQAPLVPVPCAAF